ncbi:MAG: hypothetical protein NTX50_19825 [Candidatus Sumerlaeota bacterium]|nr:hypothetical protein [Candidatus Sumerlaeota bacterium]
MPDSEKPLPQPSPPQRPLIGAWLDWLILAILYVAPVISLSRAVLQYFTYEKVIEREQYLADWPIFGSIWAIELILFLTAFIGFRRRTLRNGCLAGLIAYGATLVVYEPIAILSLLMLIAMFFYRMDAGFRYGPAQISIVFMFVLIAFLIALPNGLGDHDRSPRSSAIADMRALAGALEAYHVDHNSYPPCAIFDNTTSICRFRQEMPSFARDANGGYPLTSPIAYFGLGLPRDKFSYVDENRTYAYWTKGDGWILISPGPDYVFDLTRQTLERLYDPTIPQPTGALIVYSYDPTNGSASGGDIFRVKQ